jgi:hypothetical protein
MGNRVKVVSSHKGLSLKLGSEGWIQSNGCFWLLSVSEYLL